MREKYLGVVAIVAIVFAALSPTILEGNKDTHPPHDKPSVVKVVARIQDKAWDKKGPLYSMPSYQSAAGTAQAVHDLSVLFYLNHLAAEAEWYAGVQAELDRQAAAAAAARVSSSPRRSGGTSFSAPTECQGKVIPGYIVQRESGCDYGAVNPSGCGGAGCYGLYQIHGMHWRGGGCSDLSWQNPSDQDECARRLSSGGSNLRPWGG